MNQLSVQIKRLSGSVLGENQHSTFSVLKKWEHIMLSIKMIPSLLDMVNGHLPCPAPERLAVADWASLSGEMTKDY